MADDIYSDSDFKNETLMGLGARFKVGDFTIPPPCPASISLLEIIKSPFVVGGEDDNDEIELKDVLNALYVLFKKEKAVFPIFKAFRREQALSNAKDIAGNSPELYNVYLNVLNASTVDYAEFDAEVVKFSYDLGQFNYIEVSQYIQTYLNQSFMGFEMMPKSNKEDYEKKNLVSD